MAELKSVNAISWEETLSHFKGVTGTGVQRRAICPAHRDKHPSLSIKLSNGKKLLYCFAGCKYIDILRAAGLKPGKHSVRNAPRERATAIYEYTDEQGHLLFQKLRYKGKRFSQRRPVGQGRWELNLNGVRRVLYRLPEVLNSDTVYVVEGEKDVETARNLGLIATCNPEGASTWREEYSDTLRDKNVVIIADRDEGGRKHAKRVAQALFGKARTLKVFEFPSSKDLTEWTEGGGDRCLLEAYISDFVEEWIPSTEVKRSPETGEGSSWNSIPDILSLQLEPVTWIVDGLVPRGSLLLLTGEPASFKTWLSLVMAHDVSTGNKFLGRETSAASVLYLDQDNPFSVVRERLARLGHQGGDDLKVWGGWCKDPPNRLNDDRLLSIVQDRRPLIIVDSLIRFHEADENSASEMAAVMEHARRLCTEGATLLLIHHSGRNDSSRYRGSSDILGAVDMAFSLTRDREDETLTLECFKNRLGQEFTLTLRPNLDSEEVFTVTEAQETTRAKEDSEALRNIIEQDPGLSQSRLLERCHLPKARVRKLLTHHEGKLWNVERGPRNACRYYLVGRSAA